jgi:hypothetical protein
VLRPRQRSAWRYRAHRLHTQQQLGGDKTTPRDNGHCYLFLPGGLLGGGGVAGADLVAPAPHPQAGRLSDGGHVVVHLVDGEALLDVGGEVAGGAAEGAAPVVVLAVAVQVPLVRRPEVAHVALDHRHRVVLDVLGEAGLHVGGVGALGAPEELGLDVLGAFVALELGAGAGRERAHRALERGRLGVGGVSGGRRGGRLVVAVHHLRVAQQLLEVARGVQAVGALVDPHALLVDIAQVVQVVARVLGEEVAGAARVVAFHLALGKVLVGLVVHRIVEERVADAAHYQRLS